MDKWESTGLTIAVAGHVALFGLLSVGFLATPNPEKLKPAPIEVSLTDNVGLESQAPVPHQEELAAKLSPVESAEIPEPAPAEPAPEPQPAKPEPAPPKPLPAPNARPQPAKPTRASASTAPAKPTNRPPRDAGALDGIMAGINNQPSKGKATTPPAAVAGPEVQSSIAAAIRRQVKPKWNAPTGADVDKLITLIELRLNRDGTLAAEPRFIRQQGQTSANQPQQQLHIERAIRAIKLAAPFKDLPPEYYDAWKRTGIRFDRRLSQ